MPRSLPIALPKDISELPDDVDKLKEMVMCMASNCQALWDGLCGLQQRLFGRKSERVVLLDGQNDFLLDAQTEAAPMAQAEAPADEKPEPEQREGKKKKRRRQFPEDLPREEIIIDVAVEDRTCDCCAEYRFIGEERTEVLEHTPAQWVVKVYVRRRYGAVCNCPDQPQVVEAKLPQRVIEGGMAGPGLLAHVVVSKYADHLPLNRLEGIFARHGLHLSRSVLCDWVMKCADAVEPLVRLMGKRVLESKVVNTDDTGIPVLDKGRTHRAYLWTYVGDKEHPYTVYDFTWTRSRAGPAKFLAGFKGGLQADAFSGYDAIFTGSQDILEFGCWAHARRKFFESQSSDGVHAPYAIGEIRRMYAIERRAKGMPDIEREQLRQAEALPIANKLFEWMDAAAFKVLPKSGTGQALSYALSNKAALLRYCYNGAASMDNNAAERALRTVVVGRHNWMFAGNERGGRAAATFFSLIQSGKRHGVNLFEWLRDILDRIPGHPNSRLNEFLPDVWKPLHHNNG